MFRVYKEYMYYLWTVPLARNWEKHKKAMYHYILRSPYTVHNAHWGEVQRYCDYTYYKSIKFNDIDDMLRHYKKQIEYNDLDPNPQFFYNNTLMHNSDEVFYGYDEPGTMYVTAAQAETMDVEWFIICHLLYTIQMR